MKNELCQCPACTAMRKRQAQLETAKLATRIFQLIAATFVLITLAIYFTLKLSD